MKTKHYTPDKIFGKSILIERSPIKENEGLPLVELKYIKKDIREYVNSLKTDKKKFDYLSDVYAELKTDFDFDEVKTNLDKYYKSNNVKFEMYFEAIITKKYVKQQLKSLERKLKTKSKVLSSSPKEPEPDSPSNDTKVNFTEVYKKYLKDNNYKFYNDIQNVKALANEICESFFPNLKGTLKEKKVDVIRKTLGRIKEKLPTNPPA